MKRLKRMSETLRQLMKALPELILTKGKDHTSLDLERVVRASMMLQLSEFRFFQLAYAQWYGQEIPENRLEHIFSEYMFDDIIPHWVRHFTRKILSLSDEGRLHPRAFNIEPQEATYELRSAGIGYTVILTIVVFIFCFLITGYTPMQ